MMLFRMAILSVVLSPQQVAAPTETQNLPLPRDFVMGTAGIASFTLDWPGAPTPHWSIEVDQTVGDKSSGRYDELGAGETASAPRTHPITVTKATSDRLRSAYKTVANGKCETKLKHLAQTGTKRLAYTMDGSDVWSSCTYNYSDDAALMDATAAFEAIAETMQYGARLQHEHRFDRLSLDAEIDSLVAEAKDGRAIELQNIAPALRSIVEDDRVIERVRRKAARMLQDAGVAPASVTAAAAPSAR
jgi:hypothetical protein